MCGSDEGDSLRWLSRKLDGTGGFYDSMRLTGLSAQTDSLSTGTYSAVIPRQKTPARPGDVVGRNGRVLHNLNDSLVGGGNY